MPGLFPELNLDPVIEFLRLPGKPNVKSGLKTTSLNPW